MKDKYNIQYQDIGYMHQDSGPWFSLELSAYGDTLLELINDATISAVGQSGGELWTKGYEQLDEAEQRLVDRVLAKEVLK